MSTGGISTKDANGFDKDGSHSIVIDPMKLGFSAL